MTARDELHGYIVKAQNFSDWIYHDVRLDCDNEAIPRTRERLAIIDDNYGRDTLFGVAGWWAISAYWRLEEAHKVRGVEYGPDLTPKGVEAAMANTKEPLEKRRAFISAQQFISTLTHDDVEMAYAIFCAAYDSGVEDYNALMYGILMLSIKISLFAEKVKYQRGK